MINTSNIYEDWENVPAIFDYLNTTKLIFKISTYKGSSNIVLGNGAKTKYNNNLMIDLTAANAYSPVIDMESYTGKIKIYFNYGLKDVYSLNVPSGGAVVKDQDRMIINDLGAFLRQFPNLYSYNFGGYYYGENSSRPTVIGNFAEVPHQLKKLKITTLDVLNTPSSLFLNLDLFPKNSLLEMFWHVGTNLIASANLKVIGDLNNLPATITFFKIEKVHATSLISYTPRKIWNSNFSTFYFNQTLSSSIIDNILVDMNDSITTAIGGKLIYLRGIRTTKSDDAVLGLQNKGFTVSITA